MNRLEIPLSDSLRGVLEAQAAKNGYATIRDFVIALLENEHRRHFQASIEQELVKGLESGPAIEVDAEFWERFRARYRRRLAAGA